MANISKRLISPNLVILQQAHKAEMSGCLLEGSARSMKTWSSVDFVVMLTSKIENKCELNIIKETYNSFKTTLYKDFNRRLPYYDIVSPFENRQEVQQFKLFNSQISLLGADSDTKLHGNGCDYAYFNELLDIPESVYKQIVMRCRKFWWADYNPKAVEHWVYNRLGKRKDVAFLKTTYRDNPFISIGEKREIEGYQPVSATNICHYFVRKGMKEAEAVYACKTYDGIKNPLKFGPISLAELVRCIINEEVGSADDYRWHVYGLGERSAPEGVVFQKVKWVQSFPDNIEKIYYGNDFGFSVDPTAIIKMGVDGDNMYIERLVYEPTPSENEYLPLIKNIPKSSSIFADGAGDGLKMIQAARKLGYKIFPVKKFPGSINYGISLLKKYKIHLIDHPDWRKEQASYIYRTVNGIRLDEPLDRDNHLWDAARYAAMMNLRHT